METNLEEDNHIKDKERTGNSDGNKQNSKEE